MDDNNVQNSLCITSMKQELSGPTEAHGPFILLRIIYKRNDVNRTTLREVVRFLSQNLSKISLLGQ